MYNLMGLVTELHLFISKHLSESIAFWAAGGIFV
jgi:hypothetical protein